MNKPNPYIFVGDDLYVNKEYLINPIFKVGDHVKWTRDGADYKSVVEAIDFDRGTYSSGACCVVTEEGSTFTLTGQYVMSGPEILQVYDPEEENPETKQLSEANENLIDKVAAFDKDAAWYLRKRLETRDDPSIATLSKAFVWREAPQGFDFWYDLALKVERTGESAF